MPGAPASAPESAPERGADRRRSVRRKRRRWPLVVLGVVVALVVALAAAFSVWRWALCDDAGDFTGTWYMAGSEVPLQIEDGSIRLADDVAYAYQLDASGKTLSFTFGNLSGEARYRFSLDRQQLAIQDGGQPDALLDDAGWTIGALVKMAQGESASPAFADGETLLLTREPAAAAS